MTAERQMPDPSGQSETDSRGSYCGRAQADGREEQRRDKIPAVDEKRPGQKNKKFDPEDVIQSKDQGHERSNCFYSNSDTDAQMETKKCQGWTVA